MKKQYLLLGTLSVFVATLFVIGSKAYADDSSPFDSLDADRAHIEAQLGIDPRLDTYPHATSYYDDLEDHYEQGQLVRDDIDRGLPSGPWWAPSPS